MQPSATRVTRSGASGVCVWDGGRLTMACGSAIADNAFNVYNSGSLVRCRPPPRSLPHALPTTGFLTLTGATFHSITYSAA